MYSVKVESSFSAAHNLRGYKGKCEALHGHNWRVEAVAESAELNRCGMVVDFTVLKAALSRVLEGLDHSYLNKHAYFRKVNPTSENLARYLYVKVRKECPQLSRVRVWENPASCAEYYE
jgi:6-pyruvoyltetrahydropterin/6-carboxytetrahydropterin synthase